MAYLLFQPEDVSVCLHLAGGAVAFDEAGAAGGEAAAYWVPK